MKERPILMSGPLVIATMKGQKTQTRRVMNPQPEPEAIAVALGTDGIFRPNWWANERQHLEDFRIGEPLICPYGVPGDRLWVRESFAPKYFDDGRPAYMADFDESKLKGIVKRPKWKPSIHMPRAASRLTLEITEVRVQRVQQISEDDARAEGMVGLYGSQPFAETMKARFERIWDSINGKRLVGGKPITWAADPWVWVISYRVIK